MKLLVACEYSGVTRDAFAAFGWDAWSCDLLPTESPGNHLQGDVFQFLHLGWDLLIAHPPCPFLTHAGIGHFNDKPGEGRALAAISGQERYIKTNEAAEFFNRLKSAPIPRIALENPVPHPYARTLIGEYTQLIQPWQFGHPTKKGICLWLKNLPPLIPECVVKPKGTFTNNIGGKDRAKRRAKSFTGIAQAMAAQWTLAYLDSLSLVQ